MNIENYFIKQGYKQSVWVGSRDTFVSLKHNRSRHTDIVVVSRRGQNP